MKTYEFLKQIKNVALLAAALAAALGAAGVLAAAAKSEQLQICAPLLKGLATLALALCAALSSYAVYHSSRLVRYLIARGAPVQQVSLTIFALITVCFMLDLLGQAAGFLAAGTEFGASAQLVGQGFFCFASVLMWLILQKNLRVIRQNKQLLSY